MDKYELRELHKEDFELILPLFKQRYTGAVESILTSYYMWKNFYKTRYLLFADALIWLLEVDGEILALQAKIWAAENREIETAYEYAMTLVKRNPSEVFAWDVLGRVVAAREGADEALELIERVGEVAKDCSSLFENLGDLYVMVGNDKMARDAYMRAIELADDGLVVVPQIRHKLRKLK
jgi:predicted RNA polymerase sigma factor